MADASNIKLFGRYILIESFENFSMKAKKFIVWENIISHTNVIRKNKPKELII